MSRAITALCYLLLVALMCTSYSYALVPVKIPYVIWPNPSTGEATVYFKNSNPKSVEVLWVGAAAWNDVNQVKNKIAQLIKSGVVPYIQSYQFGDNGLRGNFDYAVKFDTEIAKVIGSNFAIINLETEWDVDEVMGIFQSSAGKQCLLNRIQAFRTYAPNSVLVSSPGLWKPASAYSFFADIDKKLNQRAMLNHVVNSYDNNCARTPWGGMWQYGAKSSFEGVSRIVENINSYFDKIDIAWGEDSYEWILSDVAVTSCGWGNQGQAQILNEISNNIDCLYSNGFRGFVLRNSGPDVNERAMGINNEGMFKFTGNPLATTVLNNGLNKIVSFFKGTSRPQCSTTPSGGSSSGGSGGGSGNAGGSGSTGFTVRGDPGLNDWWAEMTVIPAASVSSMQMKCNGQTTNLEKSSWSNTQFSKSLSKQCPIGSSVELTINGQRYAMTWGINQPARKL